MFFKKKKKQTFDVGHVLVKIERDDGVSYKREVIGKIYPPSIGGYSFVEKAKQRARDLIKEDWNCGLLFEVSEGVYIRTSSILRIEIGDMTSYEV